MSRDLRTIPDKLRISRLEREWDVTLEERLERSTRQNFERIEPRFAITPSGEQWFDLAVNYQTSGGERLSASDVQSLLLGALELSLAFASAFPVLRQWPVPDQICQESLPAFS